MAISELGLEIDDFDVEIIDQHKKTLFKRGSVKIRVHIPEPVSEETYSNEVLSSESENEENILEFIQNLITKMGYECKVNINFRKDLKLGFNIDSPNSSIIIGRKGKNLDAIQLLANVLLLNLSIFPSFIQGFKFIWIHLFPCPASILALCLGNGYSFCLTLPNGFSFKFG